MASKHKIKAGLLAGLVMATLYSAWIIVAYLLRGREVLTSDVNLQGALATYFAAGIVGGSVIGALSPLARNIPGFVFLAVIAAASLFFGGLTATKGLFWYWSSDIWYELLVLSCAVGIPTAVLVRVHLRR